MLKFLLQTLHIYIQMQNPVKLTETDHPLPDQITPLPCGGPVIRWGGTSTLTFCLPDAGMEVFILYAIQASLRRKNKKTSTALRWRLRLRSVAESNRCTRFCRPLPSHSANRPSGSPITGWQKYNFLINSETPLVFQYALLNQSLWSSIWTLHVRWLWSLSRSFLTRSSGWGLLLSENACLITSS